MAQQLKANTIIPTFALRDNLLPFQTAGTGMLLPKDSTTYPGPPPDIDSQTSDYAEPMALMGVERHITQVSGAILPTNVLEIETDQALSILYRGMEATVDFNFSMELPSVTVPDTTPPVTFGAATFAPGATSFTMPMFLRVRASSSTDDVMVLARGQPEIDEKTFDPAVSTYASQGFYTALYEDGVIAHSPGFFIHSSFRAGDYDSGYTRSGQIDVECFPRLYRTTDKATKSVLYNHVYVKGSWSVDQESPAEQIDSGAYTMGVVSYPYAAFVPALFNRDPATVSADEATENVFRLFEAGDAVTPTVTQYFYRQTGSDADTATSGTLDLRLISPRGIDMANW